jgi:hypothetical protein
MTDARTENHRDPLEAELESLRPTDLPPALIARIGDELSQREVTRRPRAWWIGAAVAAAACVALAAVVWRATRGPDIDVQPFVRGLPVTAVSGGADPEPPALATYHRALAGSPEALDALLDRQAARSLSGGTKVTASSDFAIFH